MDEQIQVALTHVSNRAVQKTEVTVHSIYYRNTISPGYKTDEKILKDIILLNCMPPQDPSHELRLNIYYKSPKHQH